MQNSKNLIGMSVVGQEDGTDLGRVRDLIFDHEANQVLALIVGEKDLFGLIEATIVPWREVQSVGEDTVLARNINSRVPLRHEGRARELAETHRDTILSGTQLLTVDGQHLGTLADLIIDESSGHVVGYEVSTGFIADTMRGKRFLPGSTDVTIGKDAAIVPSDAVEDLQRRPGNL
jgi:uncharacterized protein YrrD